MYVHFQKLRLLKTKKGTNGCKEDMPMTFDLYASNGDQPYHNEIPLEP